MQQHRTIQVRYKQSTGKKAAPLCIALNLEAQSFKLSSMAGLPSQIQLYACTGAIEGNGLVLSEEIAVKERCRDQKCRLQLCANPWPHTSHLQVPKAINQYDATEPRATAQAEASHLAWQTIKAPEVVKVEFNSPALQECFLDIKVIKCSGMPRTCHTSLEAAPPPSCALGPPGHDTQVFVSSGGF